MPTASTVAPAAAPAATVPASGSGQRLGDEGGVGRSDQLERGTGVVNDSEALRLLVWELVDWWVAWLVG
eukprot:Skav208698  [mRNA]  locus=scaffold42:222936:223636:+ [translate_table: standard]